MLYAIEGTDRTYQVEADDVDFNGAAAGSAGFFSFKRDQRIVLIIAAKQVMSIEQVTRYEAKTASSATV